MESYISSISNIAALLKTKVNLTSIKMDLGLRPGVSFLRVAEVLDPYGLCASSLTCGIEKLRQQYHPSLMVLGSRLCVLLKVLHRRRVVYVLDPCRGIVAVQYAELSSHWDGLLLAVYPANTHGHATSTDASGLEKDLPTPEKKAEQTRHLVRGAFVSMALQFKGPLANGLALALGSFGLTLVMPLFSQAILDEVLTLRDETTLWTCVTGMILATVLSVGVAVAKTLVLSEFSYRYDQLFSSQFYRHALSLSTRFFGSKKAGKILARLQEIWTIRDFVSGSSIQSFTDVFSILIFTAVLFFYSWKVAVIPVLSLPIMILVRMCFKRRLAHNYDATFEADSASKSLLTEQISAITTVKALGAESSTRKSWETAFLRGVQSKRKAQLDVTAIGGLTGFLSRVTSVAGLWVAATLALQGELSLGQLFAISMYLEYIVSPISNIAGIFSKLEQVRTAFHKLSDVIQAEPEQPVTKTLQTYSLALKGKIKFERVSFRYSEDSPWVLRDVSLTIYPRQLVAVVGRSGCGKTTLANLIAGNLRPSKGRIYFDDFDSSFLSLASLRQQLGFIIQQRDLFSGTILENIAYADDAPVEESVDWAAREANAADFITALPTGYRHYLGEGGLGLSGGQMQRLSIARTLYRQPKILLMDEATSALDFESEKMILQNMKEILASKTAVVIAHRLSTIRNADNILVMKDGEIIEQGAHSELIRAGGHYSELFSNRPGEA